MKKHLGITAALAASVAVTGCATTNPYGYNNDPYYNNGQNPNAQGAVQGATAGAVAGGVLGAVRNGRQYYRDTRGYCYYVDQYGRPIYDYNTRC